jgi:hypothetical protein
VPSPLPNHPRVSQGRARIGGSDLLIMQRAIRLIDDLGADLDQRLHAETRPAERLRLLREATNRITRTANDAIQAYARGRRAVEARLDRPEARAEALAARDRLRDARLDLLRALDAASHRYPAAEPLDEAGADTAVDGIDAP